MKVISEIQGNTAHPMLRATMTRMSASRKGSEIAIIVFSKKELLALKEDFTLMIKNRRYQADNQQQVEKAEVMHMIGTALQFAQEISDCVWFKDKADGIREDAEEFDRNSTKSLLFDKEKAYLIIAYNGRFIGGSAGEENPRIVKDTDDKYQ